MEQSDQPHRELILVTPSQLTIHQKDVSQNIASLVAFMEFLKELKETVDHEHKKSSPIFKPNTLQSYPDKYKFTVHYEEGSYTSGTFRAYKNEWNYDIYDVVNAPELSLRLLTKLIYGTLKNTSPILKGRKVLSSLDCHDLMQYLSYYLGFYNFFPFYRDEQALGSDLNIFCQNIFIRQRERKRMPYQMSCNGA